MKRPRPKNSPNRKTITGEIEKDLSQKQLALIGSVALAFNEVEKYIDLLFFIVTDLSGELQYEVSTRIGGLDGKCAIIRKGAEALKTNTLELCFGME